MTNESSTSSMSKFRAKGIIVSHTHKPINISLLSTSHHQLPSSPPHLKSSSDELPNPAQKTPRLDLDEGDSDSSTSSAAAASFVADSEDLLIQILVYLPIKSLLRFRSVSKQWLSIIADPSFRRLHFTITSSATALGTHFLCRKRIVDIPELNFLSYGEGCVSPMANTVSRLTNLFDVNHILGFHSCNGLVAIALNSRPDYYVKVFVYNPATHQHRLIPRLYVPDFFALGGLGFYLDDELAELVVCPQTRHEYIALNIVFDPLQSDHYKLVYAWVDRYGLQFATFASDTGVWRNCNSNNNDHFEDIIFNKGILWNGDLHWASEWWYTICFDLENGRLKTIKASLPQTVFSLPGEEEDSAYWPDTLFFGVSGEDLCVIGLKEPQSLLFDVFKLELDYSRWSVKYCLDLSPLTRLFLLMANEDRDHPYFDWDRCKFSVLSFLVNEKKKQQPALMISMPGKVISCEMDGMIVEEIADIIQENTQDQDEDHPRWCVSRYRWMDAFQHVETFASV